MHEDCLRYMSKLKTVVRVCKEDGVNELLTIAKSRAFKRVIYPIAGLPFRLKYGKDEEVVKKEWDNLIIFDACRYDDFREINTIPGTLESRITRGIDSPSFLKHNFHGEPLHDTVYITANPHYKKISPGVFHKIVDDPLTEWDTELQCVRPSTVTEAALRAHNEFPNKRLIIHYMQPHDPPLGPTADQIREEINLRGPSYADQTAEGMRIMDAVATGKLSVDTAREAYRETLEIVIEEASNLLIDLDGKSVITADHGEMFGEKPFPFYPKQYEHPGPATTELCKVPWFTVEYNGERRRVRSETPVQHDTNTAAALDKQLEALGYK